MKNIFLIFILVSKYCHSQDNCSTVNTEDSCCKLDNQGRKQGLWRFYQPPNCTIQSEVIYKDDSKNGKSIIYYTNGQAMTVSYYKNDTLNGLSRIFRKEGTLYREVEYKMGEVNGVSKYFDSLGQILSVTEYQNGKKNGYMRLFDSNGSVEEEIGFIQGIKNGSNKLYDDKSNLIREFIWKNDYLEVERYYCSGILIKEIRRSKGD